MAGLYIHIPFCVQKCAYCDFVSFADTDKRQAYLCALKQEIELAAGRFPHVAYDTLFIGGGTPSILSPDELERLLCALHASLSFAPDAEMSMECNPGTVNIEKLAACRAGGINRLSFGLQSADAALLSTIGRIHDFAQFETSVHLARQAGFSNISVDIMYGLPGQREAQYLDTIRAVASLGPTHISAYALILETGTPLYGQVLQGKTSLPDEDAVCDMQDAGRDLLASLGYARYEISNYAKPGFCCRHNINYWRNGPYLGLGLSAHSAMDIAGWHRWRNHDDLADYLGALMREELPIFEQVRIKSREEMFECLMLGLRMLEGVDRAAFSARFGQDIYTLYQEAIEALTALGWAELTPCALRLTQAGMDMENSALLYFMED